MGWRGYFGFCQTPRFPHEPRSVVPSKIAFVSLAAVANRAKPLRRTMPSRHIEVQCGGGGRLAHGPLANVRTPVGPTGATQRLFRLARSSPNLCAGPSLTRSNCRGTVPYARWCGRGGAARRPPIPIVGAIRAFNQRPLSRGYRPFIGPILKARSGSTATQTFSSQQLRLWRKARLRGAPRERPESVPKPPFHCERRNTLHRPERASIAAQPGRSEATESMRDRRGGINPIWIARLAMMGRTRPVPVSADR